VVEKPVSSAPIDSLLLYSLLTDGYPKHVASLTGVTPIF